MRCKTCNNKLKKNLKYCDNCGSEILVRSKKKKLILIIISVVCCFALIFSGILSGIFIFINNRNNDIVNIDGNYTCFTEGFTDVLVTDEKSAIEAVASVGDVLCIDDAQKELQVTSVNQVGQDKFYRMQQYYNDIPVYGKSVVLVANNTGTASALTSNFSAVDTELDFVPTITIEKLTDSIMDYLDVETLEIANFNDNGLILYEQNQNEFVLAYDLIANDVNVIVDAKTADILFSKKILNNIASEVTSENNGLTVTGWKNDDGSYHLYNDDFKISVFDFDGVKVDENGSLISPNLTVYGVDTLYSKEGVFDDDAISLLDQSIKISEFYKDLGYEGFDKLHVAINDSFQNGTNSRGGGWVAEGTEIGCILMGSKFDYNNVDIIAHEYTHAVTGLVVGWTGGNVQTSALNEAYSDVLGVLYEKRNLPDWKLEDSTTTRNLIEPKQNGNYAHVSEINDSDNYDEYVLSTIISHSAYLMWNGIDGNEKMKISSDLLAELWYKSLLILQSDADFSQCRNAVELSARIMLKNKQLTEEQYKTIGVAFERVGIAKATFTYTETVKNEFLLSVLNSNETEDANYKLEVIKMPVIKAGPGLVNNEKPELIIDRTALSALQSLELEDGSYVLRITDLSDEQNASQPINIKILVDGNNDNATEKVVVYTDFTDISAADSDDLGTSDNTTTTVPETENQKIVCKKVVFDFVSENGKEHAVITGYNKNEESIWSYTTPEYGCAETLRVREIGDKENKYFFVQDGTIVALDFHTGKVLWTNDEFNGSVSGMAIGSDAIYLCGQYGPDFFAVSFEGETLCNIRQFDEDYYWAQSIELKDNYALVSLHGGDFDYNNPVIFSVDLSSYDFHIVEEVLENSYVGNQSAEQLRKGIIGSWGLMDDYVFEANGVCYFVGDKNNSGTYKITDDKTLIIDFPWSHNRYVWSDLSFNEFHEDHEHDEYFWYFTTDDVLRLNGSDYYRDGVISIN